ncbi:G8 domain-containing protein DDB_G0286311-like isoform X2 [Haliotis rubra]|uniref:G8 domain-containing protein DDB_G0286311-like isoform X2 n=1 Tax=Haliotis rubra TaxID=36100 RepID=UPI001EE5AE3A|nr:G8 domain-containing protein DDB_G0286311-like isoform X2 [Haliotis rubra]
MKMADRIHWVFCATLVVSMLTLGNAEDQPVGYVEDLKRHSENCGYPPNEAFVNESLFQKCVKETNVTNVPDICVLYQNEVDRLCRTSEVPKVQATAEETKQMLNTNLDVCNVLNMLNLSPQVRKHLHGQKCQSSCSANGPYKVCRLLLILYLTGPTNFLDASKTATPTTHPTGPAAVPTTPPPANQTTGPAADPTTTPPANQTTGAAAVPTTPPPANQTTADITGWLKKLLYPALVLIACAILYLIYRKRHQILTCLKDDPESSSHRRMERALPEAAKFPKDRSFIAGNR